MKRDGSRPDMDRDRIWMDDRRWISGDGSRETDGNQSPFLYEDIEVMRSYTLLEISLISSYEVIIERRCADIRCTGGMAPLSTIPSTTQSTIQRYRIKQLHARFTMPSHTATMPIPHIVKPYEISRQRCNDP